VSICKPAFGGILLVMVTAATAGPAENNFIDSLSLTYGNGQSDTNVYRLGIQHAWDRSWFTNGNWHVTGYWNAEVGHWHSGKGGGHESDLYDLGLTPIFRLEQKSSHSGHLAPYAEAGIGLHMVSPTSIGDRNLASVFQFGNNLGVGFRFGSHGRYDLGYRFQHISNAGLSQPNQGMDIHTVNIRVDL